VDGSPPQSTPEVEDDADGMAQEMSEFWQNSKSLSPTQEFRADDWLLHVSLAASHRPMVSADLDTCQRKAAAALLEKMKGGVDVNTFVSKQLMVLPDVECEYFHALLQWDPLDESQLPPELPSASFVPGWCLRLAAVAAGRTIVVLVNGHTEIYPPNVTDIKVGRRRNPDDDHSELTYSPKTGIRHCCITIPFKRNQRQPKAIINRAGMDQGHEVVVSVTADSLWFRLLQPCMSVTSTSTSNGWLLGDVIVQEYRGRGTEVASTSRGSLLLPPYHGLQDDHLDKILDGAASDAYQAASEDRPYGIASPFGNELESDELRKILKKAFGLHRSTETDTGRANICTWAQELARELRAPDHASVEADILDFLLCDSTTAATELHRLARRCYAYFVGPGDVARDADGLESSMRDSSGTRTCRMLSVSSPHLVIFQWVVCYFTSCG
jgi:hypothetical protein